MRISIITVNLNGNRFLPVCMNSALSQDYSDLELLIIDGGSSDGSFATIQAFAARDNRVRWISEPDMGISDAMNKGISMATGGLVGFLHSDDCYPGTETLSSVIAGFASHPEGVWLTGGLNLIDQKGRVFRSFPVRKYNYQRLIRSNILFHPATFVRTETLRRSGMFNPQLRLAMDYDLWLRLGSLGDPIMINQALACFRVHDESRSIRKADDALEEEFLIRLRYLREKGKIIWPHCLHHQAKRISNAIFVRGLRRSSLSG